MSFQIIIPNPAPLSQVSRELAAYGKLNLDRGGSDISANGQYDSLFAFVSGLYSRIGRTEYTDFYTLRSAQSVGTGTKTYSLRGKTGTLLSGPVWTTAGLDLNGTNQRVYIPNPQRSAALTSYSMFVVFDSDQSTGRAVFGSTGGSGEYGPMISGGSSPFQSATATSLYHDSSYTGAGGGSFHGINDFGSNYFSGNTGTMQIACGTFNNGLKSLQVNGAARQQKDYSVSVGATAWNNNAWWYIGSRPGNYYFLGVISLCLYSDVVFSDADYLYVRDLYKATIGAGLGLP